MWRAHPDTERFLDLLTAAEFANRYYALTEREPVGDASWSASAAACADLLDTQGIGARHFRKENFFRHEVPTRDGSAWLHLTFRSGRLELGIYVSTPEGDLGGTVHGLARTLAKRRHRRASRKPPYPRVPYGGRDDAAAAVRAAIALFRQVTDAYRRLVDDADPQDG